jgi:hypothetical protein
LPVVLRLSGADDEPPVSLTPEEQAAINASKAAAARGEFATDEQVRTVWANDNLNHRELFRSVPRGIT